MKNFETLTEAMADLKTRGYDKDFNLCETFIECSSTGTKFSPAEFEITEVHRFEGDTDPGDEMILYAIESKNGWKGVMVNAFGMYADSVSHEMISKLHTPSGA